MRPQPFEQIVIALQQRNAAVVVASLGGMGKTSLVREVAQCCLQKDFAGPRFDAAVWVSDAARPGFTTLNTVLDEIAQTLNFTGLLERNEDDKRRNIEDALRSRRVLLIVDNFETVTDAHLLRWLLTLPEPSKVIITTREYRREFHQGGWQVELSGMEPTEARDFIEQRLRALHFHDAPQPEQIAPLIIAAGGNPKAMEMALGSLKQERRPLRDAVADLKLARGPLFDELFSRNWSLLDEAARRVLLAAALFGASAGDEALLYTADVRDTTYTRAVNLLIDLSLLNALQNSLDEPVRYALHPLVRTFAGRELSKSPAFEAGARQRWLDWHIQLASKVGYSRNDLKKLELLDPERGEWHVVAAWARDTGQHDRVLALASGIGFYCYMRGLLGREPNINLIAAEAAQVLKKPADEVKWMSYHLQRLSRNGNLAEVERLLPRVERLAEATALPAEAAEIYHHTKATHDLACERWQDAEDEWRAMLSIAGLSQPAMLVTVKWLAECLLHKTEYAEARQLLEDTLRNCEDGVNPRAIVSLKVTLAKALLCEGKIDEAGALIHRCREMVDGNTIDRHLPDVLLLEGRLAARQGDLPRARESITLAISHYTRVGLQRELEEAEAALEEIAE